VTQSQRAIGAQLPKSFEIQKNIDEFFCYLGFFGCCGGNSHDGIRVLA
jgi:hypothetical protein